MARRALRALAIVLAMLLIAVAVTDNACAGEITIEVAAAGRDDIHIDSEGTETRLGPYGSLSHAIAVARRIRRTRNDVTGIVIALGPGLHRLDAPVVRLLTEDSGTRAHPLVIRGSADGTTVLRGSIALEGEPVPARSYERLGEKAMQHALIFRLPPQLDLSPHIDRALPQSVSPLQARHEPEMQPNVAFEVFDDAGAMHPARWPNRGWATVVAPAGDGWWSFTTNAPRVTQWRGEPDLWAAGYWMWDYTYERHRVGEARSPELRLTTPFTFGIRTGRADDVYDALAELDEPGEWYRDAERNALIAWPRTGGARRRQIEAVDHGKRHHQ